MAANKNNPALSTKYEGSMKKLIFVAIIALVNAINFGLAVGYSSPAIPSMIRRGIIDQETSGWFGSLLTIGALLGAVVGGWLLDKIGRKWCLTITSLAFTLGFLSLASASERFQCLFGRFLTGVGSGMVTISVPIYIAEISTTSMRGLLGSCVQLSITIGIAMIYILGYFYEWRWLSHLCLISSVSAGVLTYFIPETPRRLLSINRPADAFKALAAIRDPHIDLHSEIKEMEHGLDPDESVTLSEILKKRDLYIPLFIAASVLFFQQMTGINAVMFYSVSIFQTAVGGDFAGQATIIIGIVQVFATICGVYLMDRAGRRKLLQIAGVVMAINLFLFAIYYKLLSMDMLNEWMKKWMPVVCLTSYIIGFSLGWGPVPMLIMSEIIPSSCKGAAGTVALIASWGSAFLVTVGFPNLQVFLGEGGAFCFFGICCVIAVWFVKKYVPETKGKSLEDIQVYFAGRDPFTL